MVAQKESFIKFLDNIKGAGSVRAKNIFGMYKGSGDPSVPALNESDNSQEYNSRIAIPFSYSTKGQTRRGIVYAPSSSLSGLLEASRTRGKEKLKEMITVYGAEMDDGMGLTSDGLKNALRNAESFNIDLSDAAYAARAAGTTAQQRMQRMGYPSGNISAEIPTGVTAREVAANSGNFGEYIRVLKQIMESKKRGN